MFFDNRTNNYKDTITIVTHMYIHVGIQQLKQIERSGVDIIKLKFIFCLRAYIPTVKLKSIHIIHETFEAN